jgi:hypothetical protein
MRWLLVVVTLAGCGSAQTSGPAWPKPAVTDADKDGGESLAPHESRQVATALEKSEDEAKPVIAPVAAPVTPTAVPEAATPLVALPPSVIEDSITAEDIIIEIDD